MGQLNLRYSTGMDTYIKRSIKVLSTGLCALLINCASGQMKPDEEFKMYKAQYPEEEAVFVKKSEVVDYSIVGDSIKTIIQVYEELLILGEGTSLFAEDKIYSSSFSQTSNIEAYTLLPGKRKYERIDVEEFKESFGQDSYVFYDDSKEISFTYPALQRGAKLVLKYQKTIKDPRLIGMFFFDTYLPVIEASYTLKYDQAIILDPQFFNTENVNIETKELRSETDKWINTYKAKDSKKIKFDYSSPSYNYLAATTYCPISEYKTSNGAQRKVLDSDKLHEWYRTFIAKVQGKNEEVKELVNSIIEPDDDVLEKVRKIYYWVQSNIKYIAFEDGMRGLIPHSGDYVISKRYGDCKDMASSIVSMLREANIDAHYTWIGSRDLPYKYSTTPSPVTDNHMIATFIHEGKTYFLDATGQYTPIDYPTSMIQGKECLISLGEEDYIIEEVPVMPKEMSVMSDSVNISIENETIKGTGHVYLTGYAKVFNTYKLIKSNPKSVEKYVERLLGKGSNKFEITDFEVSNVDNLSKPINMTYDFVIPDYYKQIGDNIYINLVLDKSMTDAILEDRTVAIENEYKYINRNVTRLNIPDGYEITTLPRDLEGTSDHFGYHISYDLQEDEIIVTKEYYVDYLLMQPDQFESWNEIISEYTKACRKALVLSKKPN